MAFGRHGCNPLCNSRLSVSLNTASDYIELHWTTFDCISADFRGAAGIRVRVLVLVLVRVSVSVKPSVRCSADGVLF
jgi:hypothetical protein